MRKPASGGGWPAIWYTIKASRRAGGLLRMYRALRAGNACKTCALGMGGQLGGMVNEKGRFPEVCKKSVQAMAADMRGRIRAGFFEEFGFEKLGRMTPRELEAAGRLTEPLYAGPDDKGYRAISWDEALGRVCGAMKATHPDASFFYFSGRSSNEAAFLLQVFARLYGTNNVNNCSFFCHQASGVALASAIGSGTATVVLEDLDRADLILVIGGNPASNHPRLMRTLVELKRRGGRVVVVNPLKELGLVSFRVPSDVRSLLMGSTIADVYIQPHIGGDIAFFNAVAKVLVETGQAARTFIEAHCEGFEALRDHLSALSWEELESASGVPRAEAERIAEMCAKASHAVFCWTMGITHHLHGVDNVLAIANVAMLTGNVGRPGAGLLPLRGHSNVQGIGSMGVTPQLKDEVLAALESRFGVRLPRKPGLDTLASVQKAGEGAIRFAMHLGGNLFGSCPDAARASDALRRIGTTVFLSTTLNTGHVHGRGSESIILPVRARDEEPEPTTQESMFNYVRMSEGGAARYEGPRSEVEVIATIAQQVLGDACPVDFESMRRHRTIRQAIAAIIPGYGGLGSIDDTKREFQIDGRTLHEPRFRTPSGRARLHCVGLPRAAELQPGELRLMTIRSEGQFNTVVYEEEDVYRGQERRDVILMSGEDIARLGLKESERVTVRSRSGEMRGILVREAEIRPGNAAMYYPEANVLVPQEADPRSRTPAFKNVPVRVERSSELPVLRVR